MQPSASFRDTICVISSHKTRLIKRPFASIHFAFYYQQCCHLKLTLQRPPQFQRQTTPLSLRRGAGGEALFPSLHSTKWLGVRLKGAGISALFEYDELTRRLGWHFLSQEFQWWTEIVFDGLWREIQRIGNLLDGHMLFFAHLIYLTFALRKQLLWLLKSVDWLLMFYLIVGRRPWRYLFSCLLIVFEINLCDLFSEAIDDEISGYRE